MKVNNHPFSFVRAAAKIKLRAERPTPMKTKFLSLLFLLPLMNAVSLYGQSTGAFSDHDDIGSVGKTGSMRYDSAKGEYLVSGSGENMWFTNDAFHFAYARLSGDFTLTADIRWVGAGGNAHRKACLMIRQSLNSDAAYADVALHGDGLTSLQYRETDGNTTHEIQSGVSAPARLRLEKRGNYISMSLASSGQELKTAGGYLPLSFKEPFYAGLAVCAHDNKAIEQAVFSKVELTAVSTTAKPTLESTLEVVPIASTDRRVVYRTRDHIEAPNWSLDGKYFLFNNKGRICKLPVSGGVPTTLDTGAQIRCNNDHGISPDGKFLAVSDQAKDGKSRIFVLPIEGGTPREITPLAPSYWHGWSPDGKTLAYCAERKGEFDVYTIPADGGEEKRLTTASGLDDGPEYSPDGKFIYFNSDRTGLMQIWRMKPDGSDQEQVTSDPWNNWFAHPSPDGKWIVFLTFDKDVKGHPENKDVTLRLMSLADKKIKTIAKLFGGQGTINVPSWSPDSRQVAFVSYQFVYP